MNILHSVSVLSHFAVVITKLFHTLSTGGHLNLPHPYIERTTVLSDNLGHLTITHKDKDKVKELSNLVMPASQPWLGPSVLL